MTENVPWPGPYQPAQKYNDSDLLSRTLTSRVLPLVTAPARYIGGELGAVRDGFSSDQANILLAFPDVYEVGMSHQGLRILYSLLKERPDTFCDLAYTPWPDMQQALRKEGLPLFGLESRQAVGSFDLVGFSLGYELAYTNMLAMIDLAGSPVLAADRREGDPVFVAGGSCTLNPAVMGPFLDVVFTGDGEEVILQAAAIVETWKTGNGTRAELVAKLLEVPGAWHPGVTEPVRAATITDLNDFNPPGQLVPVIEPVHDRLALEVMRGCARGCRFCQAGMITRPVRERDPDTLAKAAIEGVAESGYSEVSLLSLSTSDYSCLDSAVSSIQDNLPEAHTNLVLPSLRVDSVSDDLFERISRERPANFTFAPEAGSQRLRDVINKQIDEETIVAAAAGALKAGVKGVKLYFMIGLPTETNEDLDELVALVGRVVGLAPRGGSQIHVSISPFAPKAHTPFQWAGQISRAEMDRRNSYLGKRLNRLRVKVSLRDPDISFLEAVLGLGDARLAAVVQRVWQDGGCFDAWSEYFDFARWDQAFAAENIDPTEYTAERNPDADLPWDTVSVGMSKSMLRHDWQQSVEAQTLPDCRIDGPCYNCAVCGGPLQHVAGTPPTAGKALPSTPSTEPDAGPDFDPRNADPDQPEQELKKWRTWRQQAAAKCWYRIEFRKTGDMVFLGHLDFQRQLHLALRRSGLPTAYSRGYHPHPLMKFGPPLPVGIAGLRETLDVAFECQVPGWPARLNRCLPEGLHIGHSVVVGGQTPRSIDQCAERFDYKVVLPTPAAGGPTTTDVVAAVDVFLAAESWPCIRHRAKGDIEIDARPLVVSASLGLAQDAGETTGCELRFSLVRGENGGSLPVHDFLTALLGDALPESGHCAITRLGYYGRQPDGRWMRPIEEVGESSYRFWLQGQIND